jgi:hypothetical protein
MDPAIRARLAPFRLERAYSLLIWGVRWMIIMTVLAVPYGLVILPIIHELAAPDDPPALLEWWPVWGNMLIALIWIGLGARGLGRFYMRRLRYWPFAEVLRAARTMVRKDLLNTEIWL